MSSNITRDGREIRPAFSYNGRNRDMPLSQCELLESCRNVMEDVRAELRQLNALLACRNFTRIPSTLRKIAANTEKRKPAKKAKGEL